MLLESASYLWDARVAAAHIHTFAAGVSLVSYRVDDLRKSAVERQLEILGEALNRLRRIDELTASRIPDLHRIVGMRNVLAHGYATVEDAVVWEAATQRVPEVARVIELLLLEHESEGEVPAPA